MAYNEKLADRVRVFFEDLPKVEEKNMMGGLTFMVNGKMCVGILKDELMARIDPDVYDSALERQGCREMNFTGKPMRGFVFVDESGTEGKKSLDQWLNLALEFNKRAKASKPKKKIAKKK
jgi:TfoX/Sxy family transcriptional regulator of competence genes